MKKLLPVLLLLLGVISAVAQDRDYPDLIRKTNRYLSVFGDDSAERLNLAWYYMLNAQPDSALVQYDEVSRREPANPLAASGSLWALNYLAQYSETVSRSDTLIHLFPQNPDIFNHRGLALLQTRSPLKARTSYQTAGKLAAPDSDGAAIANTGLAWSYLNLGDYANAEYALKSKPGPDDLSAAKSLEKTRFSLSGGFGYKQNGDTYYMGKTALRKKTLGLALGFEEYRISGDHYRTASSLELDQQFPHLSVRLEAKNLSGVDENLYPAWQGGASVSGRIYSSAWRFRPLLSAHYTYTPVFSAAQADIGCWAGNDQLDILLMYSGLYLDKLAVDTDQRGNVFTGIADLRLYRSIRLSFSASHGDMGWWTNPWGITLDSFDVNPTNLGLGLFFTLGSRFGLSIYSQLGFANETYNYLVQSVLTFNL